MRNFGSSFAFSFQSYRTAVLAVSKADEQIGRVVDLGAGAFVTELQIREFVPRVTQRFRGNGRRAGLDYFCFASSAFSAASAWSICAFVSRSIFSMSGILAAGLFASSIAFLICASVSS